MKTEFVFAFNGYIFRSSTWTLTKYVLRALMRYVIIINESN